MSTYLKFVECQNDGRKTKVWMVRNSTNQDLAAITFRPQWRRYVLVVKPEYNNPTYFDASCLEEIVAFLKSETEKWRASQ